MRNCFRSAIETGFIALTYSQLCIINMIKKKGGTTRLGAALSPHFVRVVLKKSVFLYLLRPKRSFMPSRSKPRVKRMVWSKGLVWLVLKT